MVEKTKCKYCNVAILKTTAEKTNGFCMPHANERNGEWVAAFIFEYGRNKDFWKDIEEQVNIDDFVDNNPDLWRKFRKVFKDGDIIVHFTTSPFSWNNLFGRAGYAIKRDGEIIKSLVTLLN